MGLEQWYTLCTKPNAEYQVAIALQKRGVQAFLPEIESSGLDQRPARKPFFPCYLFAKIDFESIGFWQLQWTPGLRYVVAFDNQPVPLANEVIELIRHKLAEFMANKGRPALHFNPGETVRINAGPFQNMLAIFDGPTTPGQRVQVLLTFLGHASRMWVDIVDLEKALPCAEAPAPKRSRRTRGQGRYIKRTVNSV